MSKLTPEEFADGIESFLLGDDAAEQHADDHAALVKDIEARDREAKLELLRELLTLAHGSTTIAAYTLTGFIRSIESAGTGESGS